MSFRGVVRNGRIEVGDSGEFPDGTAVEVRPAADLGTNRRKRNDRASDPVFHISDLAIPFGRVDGAREHDHYIYGTPKKSTRKKVRVKSKKAVRRK